MNRRENDLVWLKDMLEHLQDCRERLEWIDEPLSVRMLTETMLRELDSCRRLCETMRRRGQPVLAG